MAAPNKNFGDETLGFLSVGTRILMKDVMDQTIRSSGPFRTFYAPTMASAMRAFQENAIHVLISEVDYEDGSAFRLIQNLGGVGVEDDLFVVLAMEADNEDMRKLAGEIEAHEVLVKPFSAADLKHIIDKFGEWRVRKKLPWQVYVHDGMQAARQKKFREAENKIMNALRADPSNPITLFKVASYYFRKPDLPVAEKLLKKAIQLKPDFVQAISMLGTLYLNKRDLDHAEICLRKAQELSPMNPDRFAEIVQLNLERCSELCRKAIRLDPANVKAHFHLGRVMAMQREYIPAVAELEKVIPHLPDNLKLEAQVFVALSKKLGGIRAG